MVTLPMTFNDSNNPKSPPILVFGSFYTYLERLKLESSNLISNTK